MRVRKVLLIPILTVIVALAAVVTATTLMAEPKDGRLNIEAHFGGDALYCVDVNLNPTTVYPSDGQGGLRLLDLSGNEKWFIPAATILAKGAEATANNAGVEVATGWGTYGPASLFVYVEGGVPKFTFVGMDEHGKQNSFMFSWCDPVGKRTFPHGKDTGGLCSNSQLDGHESEETFIECSKAAGCGSKPSYECFCSDDHYGGSATCEI